MTGARFPTQCTCSAYNAHRDDWLRDPDCPRHGLDAALAMAHPTLDIDEPPPGDIFARAFAGRSE